MNDTTPNIIIKSRKKQQRRNILDIDISSNSKKRKEINNGYVQAIERSVSNCNYKETT